VLICFNSLFGYKKFKQAACKLNKLQKTPEILSCTDVQCGVGGYDVGKLVLLREIFVRPLYKTAKLVQ